MVPALCHLVVDGRMTLSRQSLFIVGLVEGSHLSHCFLAVLATRWVVRYPFHKIVPEYHQLVKEYLSF
jgi:hypothetical protein